MKNIPSIGNAELEVMNVLWEENRPMKIQEVCDRLEKWKYNTVGTMLIRLEEKGVISSEKINRANYYKAVIDKEEYKKTQTKNLVSRLYDGSAKELAVSLFKSGDISAKDIEEIKEMFNL